MDLYKWAAGWLIEHADHLLLNFFLQLHFMTHLKVLFALVAEMFW